VYNAEISVELAERALQTAMEPATEAEVQEAYAAAARAQETLDALLAGASEAELTQAQADVARASEALEELADGAAPEDVALSEDAVAQAELSLAQAMLALEAAQRDLADTALLAPVAGTVTAVAAEVGERVGSAALVTLASGDAPMLELFVDESDFDKVAVGNAVQVELDAMPDMWLDGTLVQVDPALVTESGVQVIRGLVALDAAASAHPDSLLIGMSATVEIIAGQTTDAVLVPVEALRELDVDEYAVFVMEDGEPKLRVVEVGLQDYAYAEILSGLEAGETVTTGIVEVK
jgi:RND family efflux transporter MFP subunit